MLTEGVHDEVMCTGAFRDRSLNRFEEHSPTFMRTIRFQDGAATSRAGRGAPWHLRNGIPTDSPRRLPLSRAVCDRRLYATTTKILRVHRKEYKLQSN